MRFQDVIVDVNLIDLIASAIVTGDRSHKRERQGVPMKQTRRQPATIIGNSGQLQLLLSMKDVMQQPLLLTVPEVAVSLRLSRAKVYRLIYSEGLPVVHFGRAVRVSVKALEQWLERREQGA